MNEIIEMAKKCGLVGIHPHLDGIYMDALLSFAKLVAKKEREACAKVCEDSLEYAGETLAEAIRARGQA